MKHLKKIKRRKNDRNKIQINTKRGNKNYSNKNSNNPIILKEESYQISFKNFNNPIVIEGGSYQTFPGNFINLYILGKGNYQTSLKENNSGISEGGFQTSTKNSIDCEKGSYQILLRKST